MKALDWLLLNIKNKEDMDVLELGTKRSILDRSTSRKFLIPKFKTYIMSDFQDGLDVDVVADAHSLSKTFPENSFDLVWGFSIFEHLEKPWLASEEIKKVLRSGGCFFFQTHFCFPEHAYPNDYFRYTEAGLVSIFDWAVNTKTSYEFPCEIVVDNPIKRSGFLNVNIAGNKPV